MRWRFAACVLATTALLAAAALIGHTPRPSRVALCLLLAGVPYLGLLTVALPSRLPGWFHPSVLAAVPGAVMVLGDVALSDDLYRFAWDARVWLAGHNAYDFAPASPALAALRDQAVWTRINHATIPTIYPPLAQGLFVLGYGALELAGLKLFALLGHLLVAAFMPRLARALGATQEQGRRAAWLWALNPLAVSESAMAGHYDVWLGLSLLGLSLAFHWRRPRSAAALLIVAAGLKVVGLFLVPTLWRRHARAASLAALLSIALCIPLMRAGRGDGSVSGIGHFGQRWQGNAGLFVLLERAAEPLVLLTASDVGGPGNQRIGPDEIAFDYAHPLLGWAHLHGIDPGGALATKRATPRRAYVFPRRHAVGLVARALAVSLVLGLAFLVGRAREPDVRPIVLTLLLLSPQVHPWYLLWLLPLELARGQRVALVWTLAILATYAPLDAWRQARQWHESPHWTVFEYALVLACYAWESRVILRTSLTRIGQRFRLEAARNPR